jgi:hypothetical protein
MDLLSLFLSLIVLLLIFGLLYWAVHRIEAAFGVPEPIVGVIDVILVVAVVLVLIGFFTGRVPPVYVGHIR